MIKVHVMDFCQECPYFDGEIETRHLSGGHIDHILTCAKHESCRLIEMWVREYYEAMYKKERKNVKD